MLFLIYRLNNKFSVKEFFEKLIAAIIGIVSPILPVLLTTYFLIIVDMVLGLIKMKKTNEPFSWKKFSFCIIKSFIYGIIILAAFTTQTYIMPLIPVTTLVASLIAANELKSISQNSASILGYDAFKNFFKYLKKSEGEEDKKDI